jgi:hypothetical protein
MLISFQIEAFATTPIAMLRKLLDVAYGDTDLDDKTLRLLLCVEDCAESCVS